MGIPSAEETVRGHGEFCVRVRERHLNCILYVAAFAPETKFEGGAGLAGGGEDSADVRNEEAVVDEGLAEATILGVPICLRRFLN